MAYSTDQLRAIFDRTDGYCHICGKKLCLNNYGQFGSKGAWEVEHSNAKCNGGSDRLCNLYPAHIPCNREKGAVTTRTARTWNGITKAPLSKERKEAICSQNRWGFGAIGALIGGALGGPVGLVICGFFGAWFGDEIKPS